MTLETLMPDVCTVDMMPDRNC